MTSKLSKKAKTELSEMLSNLVPDSEKFAFEISNKKYFHSALSGIMKAKIEHLIYLINEA